ncbi:MBL fold metallo-hydrolase [Ornithinimicrobium humiphilum]|uniref:Glyoxylase-like metal-dependent hydrolase (Beta-lactamase superfamily II) n=1 Tax=Ornithinimicrobium humiphilum TaxID=125288 RepID=A0A543KRN1_9MICO|nr:MBL fold metallo-hydrolase [Ornithinimicrobium humiphilum]TQM97738.1 glyoxylase-like metal-dependent hydrolase (beta-lactamase superfamily II) [Ornithinimicrobium humiphilum]
MAEVTWRSVAPGVFVRRHEELKLNCGLVVGQERALVIDTRSYHEHGLELLAAVREITDLEIVVVNTHAHYDHCFGNSAFRDSQIYAHVGLVDDLLRTGEHQREQVVEHLRATDREEMARMMEETELVPPFYLVEEDTVLDLGGRTVELLWSGRGHTDHDLAVAVPDAHVVFAGDLVEEGADPAMEDSYPLEWAATLRTLLARPAAELCDLWVPGHGRVVDRAFVEAQCAQLTQMAERFTEVLDGGLAGVDALVSACRGLGLEDQTLRDASLRALELRP